MTTWLASVATLREPLRYRSYRRIWASQLLSEIGDWAARIAVTALVYERSGSAALAASAYAVTLLPWLGPGQWLGALADRYGRRVVLVVADLVRATAFLVLCLPMPVWALLAVTFVAGLAAPPFAAARAAAMPEVVPRERLGAAVTLSQVTADVSIVTGNLAAGALLALVGPVPALGLNAATFVASALLLRGLPALVPQPDPGDSRRSARASLEAAARGLLADRPVVTAAVTATAAAGAATAVESLVVPFSADVAPQQLWLPGAVLASVAVVTIVVTLVSPTGGRPERLLRWTVLTSVVGSAVGMTLLAAPTAPTAIAGMVLIGALFVPLVTANVFVAPRIPAAQRASAFGLLMGALAGTQAVLAAVAGVLADLTSPGVAAAAVLGVPLAVGVGYLARLRTLEDTVRTAADTDRAPEVVPS